MQTIISLEYLIYDINHVKGISACQLHSLKSTVLLVYRVSQDVVGHIQLCQFPSDTFLELQLHTFFYSSELNN